MSAATRPAVRPEAQTGWVRRLWGYLLRHRVGLFIALGASLLGGLFQVATPLVARQIMDGVIGRGEGGLGLWLTLLLVFAAATFGFAFLRRYRGGRVAFEVQNELRLDMHSHLQSMDFRTLDSMPTGQLVARANSDSTLVMSLLMMLPIVSGNLVMLALSLVVMFVLSPLLALVALAVVPALVAVSYRMRSRVFPATWDAQQREGDVVQIVDEATGGVRVVKAFGQERRELDRLADSSVRLYGSQMRTTRIQSRFQPLLESIPVFGQVGVLALGGWLAIRHQITLGTFLAFSTYLAQMLAPARQLAGLMAIAQQARAGVERIAQLLDTAPAIADAPDAEELPVLRGEIEFRNVRFSHAAESAADGAAEAGADGAGAPILDGLSLRIAPGERVALVGGSGSGKTTAAMLVPRFHDPQGGAVLVDGRDVRGVTLDSLRRQIGVVFEDSFLFSESVRFNIAYSRPDATNEEVAAAARIAQAEGFISELRHGYDTVVGERGQSLSGGQRQRIALARAILAEPRILLLDDATSAIDARTEEAIHEGLTGILGDRTVLLVAHRRSTLHLADRVVLLEDGRVADEGTHDELTERNERYRALLSGMPPEEASLPVPDAARAGRAGGVTSAAWPRPGTATDSAGAAPTGGESGARPDGDGGPARGVGQSMLTLTPTRPTAGRPNGMGGGMGGGGRGKGPTGALAATPQLLAQVAKLPPVKDVPTVDVDAEAAHRPEFSLRTILREYRKPLLVGLVLVLVDALCGLVGPILVKSGLDEGVQEGSMRIVMVASAVFLFITLVDLLAGVGETFVLGRAAQRVMLALRIRVFAQLQRLSLDYYEREMAGRIMTRMTTDVSQFEQLVENGLLSALVAIVTFVGVGVALFVVDAPLALATLTVVVPLAFATVAFRRRAKMLYELSRERISIVNADFQESLSGVHEAQAFVHEDAARARFRALGASYVAARTATQKIMALYFPFVQFLSAVADAIVLGLGAVLIERGHLTTGALVAFMLYVNLFFSPIQQLSQVFDSWQQTTVSARRIAGLMRLDTLTPQAPDAVEVGRLRGEMALDEVHFAYPGAEDSPEALVGLSLGFAPGETVALVGETGAGKSTIMKLLARFYDVNGGSVLADGTDVRRFTLDSYRGQLGYVPQEAFLFTGSVRDNIAYGRPDASDAEVEAAARAVGAHEFIASLPQGYLSAISERGRSLSAGQRQLMALARAELVDPPVLLLDEATSNLDLVTEARVGAAMRAVARERTTVIVAHRLQTAAAADRVVVLDHGAIVEQGSHEELLELGGRYAALWRVHELATQG